MNDTFKNILIVSDLDGTLIGDNFEIPQRNIDAIRRFQKKGGNFTIATGRSEKAAIRYVNIVKPATACIFLNGGLIFDVNNKKIIYEKILDSSARGIIKQIIQKFPSIGIEIFSGDNIYMVVTNQKSLEHVSHENLDYISCTIDEVSNDNWYKVLFSADEDKLSKLTEFTKTLDVQKIRFVRSASIYFEMLPDDVNKGTALKKLAKYLNLDIKNTYAIGDYYNDIEMLNSAGVGVATANAPDDIKEVANYAVCHCNEGAIAELIEKIEANNR